MMNPLLEKLQKAVEHELDVYSTWETLLDLPAIGREMVEHGFKIDIDNYYQIGLALKLSLYSNDVFAQFKSAFPQSPLQDHILWNLDDFYHEATTHGHILDRIEEIHHFCTEQAACKDHLLLPCFPDHPRARSRLNAELCRDGERSFLRRLMRINAEAYWPLLLTHLTPDHDHRKRCFRDLETEDLRKIVLILEKHFTRREITDFWFRSVGGLTSLEPSLRVFTLEDLTRLYDYDRPTDFLSSIISPQADIATRRAIMVGVLLAQENPMHHASLAAVSHQARDRIRAMQGFEKKTAFALGWATGKEKRSQLEQDMGI